MSPVAILGMACATAFAALVWAFRANDITLEQRLALIEGGWLHNRATRLAYDSVSYNQHFWAVLLFQNPMDLYRAK